MSVQNHKAIFLTTSRLLCQSDRMAPTVNVIKPRQYKVSVNQIRNALTKPDRMVSCTYRVSLMSLFGAERGKRVSILLGQTTHSFIVIAAHAHHERAITTTNVRECAASIFSNIKFLSDRHASVRVIANPMSFSEGFTLPMLSFCLGRGERSPPDRVS